MPMDVSVFVAGAVGAGATAGGLLAWAVCTRRQLLTERAGAARFQAMVERAPLAMCLRDDQDRILFANPAFRTLFAWPTDADVVGRPLFDCFATREQGQLLDRSRRRRAGEVVPTSYPTVARRADGHEFPVMLAVTLLDTGTGPGALTFILDLSEQRRTEAALVTAERDAVLGRMAARVAHEVNNPLEAIKIYIEPLRKRVADLPQVDRGLVVIDQQVERIARLVRGLLGFARQRALLRSSVEISAVIHTVAELLQPRFAKQGKQLSVTVPACHGTLDVDGIQQVLLNLLDNAHAAIPAGGWVRVEGTATADRLTLDIRDNGPGLGADPEALFTPFTTSKPEGTGLGLNVARRICVAHGGSLTGANHPDGGAVFTVVLHLDSHTNGDGIVAHDPNHQPPTTIHQSPP